MKTKKFTIEEIFDTISEMLPYLEYNYKELKKTKKFKEDPIAFPLYCLLIFEHTHTFNTIRKNEK